LEIPQIMTLNHSESCYIQRMLFKPAWAVHIMDLKAVKSFIVLLAE